MSASTSSHWPNVRDKPEFLRRLMVELVGDARISIEGDLSKCQFLEQFIVCREETELLKRGTTFPQQDFVILQLTKESVTPILQQILKAGLKRAILHVKIEREGILELQAYDNFHPECIVTGPGIRSDLLQELKQQNIIRDFIIAPVSHQASG